MKVAEFEEFFRATYPQVRAYVAKKVARDDVEDILQETFSAIWDGNYPAPSDAGSAKGLRALAFRIADRRVADLYRAKARQDRKLRAVAMEPTETTSPSALDQLLDDMPPAWLYELSKDALEVLLRFVAGASVSEIAEDLGITPNAVSSRLKRIRERTPELLRKEVADEQDS
ncbi:MAG: sigma-70 family RNA polymerase sigma factor [Nocardioidaceae bacterium]